MRLWAALANTLEIKQFAADLVFLWSALSTVLGFKLFAVDLVFPALSNVLEHKTFTEDLVFFCPAMSISLELLYIILVYTFSSSFSPFLLRIPQYHEFAP